MLLVVIPKLKA